MIGSELSFDEHDEEDQAILWERQQGIAQDNLESQLLCEEEIFEGNIDNG